MKDGGPQLRAGLRCARIERAIKEEITMPATKKGPARNGAAKTGLSRDRAALELQASSPDARLDELRQTVSSVRILVLCVAIFALFVIAPVAFFSGGSKSKAAEQKGGAIGATASLAANPKTAKARLSGAPQDKEPSAAYGGFSYKNDVSPRLRDMTQLPIVQKPEHEAALNPKLPHNHADQPDPVVQNFLVPDAMPATLLNFAGIPFPGVACNCAPPDTNGEVGLTQYVQIVNEGFQVFNKSTGASVFGPAGITTIWSGFGGVCQNNGHGDPVVIYDQIANRWVISQFAGVSVPTDECIAVSTTSDATGSYNRYGFHLGSNFFDYPKIGMWPAASNNGYYMSDNVFNSAGTAFLGTQAFAFDRAAMLAGAVAAFVTPGPTPGGSANEAFLPADLDGSTLPSGPCPFVEFPDGGNGNTYRTWLFHPDFVTPANSTFVQRASPAAAPYTALCSGTRTCVPQPAGTNLDGIGDRLMHRLPYRIIGGVERIVGNYTVSSGGVAGIRWFELRNVTSGVESVFQQSTYQPDTTWRWMGSIAQDQSGDIALGFSASSTSVFPSVRSAGRLAGDPANTLAQGETNMFTGLGSQSGTSSRWGDYSAMSIDPVDDCTFWYTQEYYPSGTTSFNWRTRIASFKFPGCGGAVTNDFSISANPTSLSLGPGNSGTSTISTAVISGSAETVALTVSGTPAGASASLSPTSVTAGGSSTLTVNAGTAAAGTYTLTITGTAASATHSTTVMLTVTSVTNDFSISANPTSLSLSGKHSSGTSNISTAVTSGGTQTVTFSISGVPRGATASFSPTSVSAGGSSTLTVNSGSARAGTYTLTVTGTGASATHSTSISLTVTK